MYCLASALVGGSLSSRQRVGGPSRAWDCWPVRPELERAADGHVIVVRAISAGSRWEVAVRRKRDDRRLPDDRDDVPAEDWLKEFRPVRPEALTAADRDARHTGSPGADAREPGQDRGRPRRPAAPPRPRRAR